MGKEAIIELVDEELANLEARGYSLDYDYDKENSTYSFVVTQAVGRLTSLNVAPKLAASQLQYMGNRVADAENMSEYIKLLVLHRKAIEVKNLDVGKDWGYILDEGIDHTRLRQELLRDGFWINSRFTDSPNPGRKVVHTEAKICGCDLTIVSYLDEVTEELKRYLKKLCELSDWRNVADLLQLESGLLEGYAEAGIRENGLLAETWQLLADELYRGLDLVEM